MVSINFTIVVELALFLLFLGVTNRFIFRPLLRTMDEREATVARDREAAAAGNDEARTLETLHAEKVMEAHRTTTQRIRDARDEAYRHNRQEMDALRQKADQELGVFRAQIAQQLATERKKFAENLPSVVKAIDERLHVEGSVL